MLPQAIRTALLFVFGLLSATGSLAAAQGLTQLVPGVFDLSTDRDPMMALDGQWRFHTGDDPGWANPKFDDSGWQLIKGDGGWESQGFKGYSGYAWYRARVVIPAHSPQMELSVPSLSILTGHQIFADGRLLEGCSRPRIDDLVVGQTEVCALATANSAVPQTVVLAIRVWHSPQRSGIADGGLRGPLRVGGVKQIEQWSELRMYARKWSYAAWYVLVILSALAALAAFCFYLLRQRERVYLWFGLTSLFCSALYIDYLWRRFHGSAIPTTTVIAALLGNAQLLTLIEFYQDLLGERRNWIYRVVQGSVLLYLPLAAAEVMEWISPAALAGTAVVMVLPFSLWVVVLIVRRAIQGSADARLIALPALMQPAISMLELGFQVAYASGWIRRYPGWIFETATWPFIFGLEDLSQFLFLIAMAGILIFRFNRASMQGERMAAELEAARTAQRVLVPEQLAPIEGYRIESAYQPAQELSGDFYQVLPAGGGATLLALGDVSGKGLTAAMTGTLAIGVMRQLAVEGLPPAELLAALNNRLVAAGPGGFITLVCVLMGARGEATLAKAGHLNPYLDGDEVDLGASLPLGLAADADYTELRLTLNHGSRLTLLSDGVVEARGPSGELFGFDRTRGLSARPAKEIAAAAKDFGQDDDITVLTIQRTEALTV